MSRQMLLATLARFELHTAFVHLVQVLCGLEIFHNIVLQLWNRLQEIRRALELLDVLKHVAEFVPFAEINHAVGHLIRNAVFDEDEVGKIDP